MSEPTPCRHCGLRPWCSARHRAEHPALCCDCFDLSHGMPLAAVNAGRAAARRPPIARPWPGKRRAAGWLAAFALVVGCAEPAPPKATDTGTPVPTSPVPPPAPTTSPPPAPTTPPPPDLRDCDLDGLVDLYEVGCASGSTEPGLADSDGGGEVDGAELRRGADPCDPADDQSPVDRDDDLLNDDVEWVLGTDPEALDTDGDGAYDVVELLGVDAAACTGDESSPLVLDSDGDGIDDGEDLYPADPLGPGMRPDAPAPCVFASDEAQDVEFARIGGAATWQWVGGSGTEELHIGAVDPVSGELVDGGVVTTGLAPVLASQTGPEWLYDGDHAEVVFTKDAPDTPGTSTIWRAWPDLAAPSGWSTAPFTGEPLGVGPFGTFHPDDPDDRWVRWSVLDEDPTVARTSWVRHVDDPASDYVYGVALTAHRFVFDMPGIVLVQPDPLSGVPQVFLHVPVRPPPATPALTRITADLPEKQGAFSWADPVVGQVVMTTLISAAGQPYAVAIYRMSDGARLMTLPAAPDLPYVVSPEPFLWQGRSYISYEVSRGDPPEAMVAVGHLIGSRDGPSEMWIARVDADPSGQARFVRRVTDRGIPIKAPEPYTAGATPWIYYTNDHDREIWRCETGL